MDLENIFTSELEKKAVFEKIGNLPDKTIEVINGNDNLYATHMTRAGEKFLFIEPCDVKSADKMRLKVNLSRKFSHVYTKPLIKNITFNYNYTAIQ